tara:strand:- start:8854 stop:9195 length:342 start_codon:yes stop_codon:yes gene_type:complete
MEISGTIKKILPLKSGTSEAGYEWKKRDVILTQFNADPKYVKDVCITAFGDKALESMSRFIVGDTVDVKVNVESREFNGKYYTNLTGHWWANKNSHNEESVDFVTADDEKDPF